MTRYPLSAMPDVGLEVLERLGLTAEANTDMSLEEMTPFVGVLVSGHAPTRKDGMRLNIAATDDFRQVSIGEHLAYVDAVSRLPRLRQVNIHFAPKRWVEDTQLYGQESDYGLMIDAIMQIASFAAERGKEIVLENHIRHWTDIPDDVTGDGVDWTDRNGYFGVAPEEWIGACKDVDRQNVALCLDTSHACTHTHLFPEEKRPDVLMSFLAEPQLIRHVHWSDSYLYDQRGRTDSHAVVGKGSLPTDFHRAKGVGCDAPPGAHPDRRGAGGRVGVHQRSVIWHSTRTL